VRGELVGTGALVRLILRRDRLVLPAWLVPVGLLPVGVTSSLAGVVPTEAARTQMARTMGTNTGFVALYGELRGSSIEAIAGWRLGFVPVVVAVIGLLMVIRHTRADEEVGRRDLLGSTVVGRHAPLAAALLATVAAMLALAGLVALGLIATGAPAAGSWALGAQFAAGGIAFAAVGAVAAQLTEGAGSARGIALSVLGAAFLLRSAGDVAGGWLSWLSWLSPLGWVVRLHPYGGDRWWVLGPILAFAVVLAALAAVLSARRDVGGGLFATRLGPAAAAAGLRTPVALAWRLQRGLVLGWVIGLAAIGLVFGAVAESVGDIVRDNPILAQALERFGGRARLVDTFLATVMGLVGLIAAGYAIQATLRLRYEETTGRAEPLLATAVGRVGWAASHLVFAALGPAMALAAAGLATGVVHGLNTGQVGREVPRTVGAALVQLPAVWVLAAFAVALYGLLPRAVPLTWGLLGGCLLLSLLGPLLRLNQSTMDLSPFTHVPRLPGAALTPTPLVWLAAAAAALALVGLAGLRRRDFPLG